MQQPTCTDVRIRSTADAHKIFGAVQQGILQMVTRRLDADERLALRSGCIYAWEERGPHSEITGLGIERFTEGRRWSPSRVRDEFLFYYEKYSPPPDVNHLSGNSVERQPPRDWDPLVKQTYSVWVETSKGRRKWHLTAYFTQATIDQLGTIENISRIRDVVVPEGMFKSTRVGKGRNKAEDHSRSDVARAATSISRTYAPFPTPYQYQAQNGSPSMMPVLMHEPYQTSHSSERHSSAYEPSPSPVSPHLPHLQGQYAPSETSHHSSNSSIFPSNYGSNSLSLPHPISSPSQSVSGPYQIPPMHHSDNRPYYSSGVSSSSWSSSQSYYENSPPQRPSQAVTPSSSTYTNMTSHGNSHTSPYTYPSQVSPMQSNTYTPSYSLNAALIPPPRHLDADTRAMPLSPLQVPDRSHLGSQTQGSPISPTTGQSPEGGSDCALAPLNVLKRPIRYRREPADEKTLRLLRAPRSSP